MASISPLATAVTPPAASQPAVPAAPAAPSRFARWAPALLSALLAAVYLVWAPPSIDLAATEYRIWLFGDQGLSLYDLQWYAGHHMPGYSVLLPPLGWLLGPRLLGALCVVAATALFAKLARDRFGDRALLGTLWFALGSVTILLSGRVTFALGLAPALAALLALERAGAARPGSGRRRLLAATAFLCALLSALASPVAAVFLAMAGTAVALAQPLPPRGARRPPARTGVAGRLHAATAALRPLATPQRVGGIALAAAAVVPVLALAVAFPEGGTEPFVLSSYWPVPAAGALALWLFPRELRTLRIAVVLYVLGCTAAFLLDTPVGGNSARLGALCAGPLFALVLWPRRRLALALLALPLLYWQWTSAIHDVRVTHGDPSVEASFYAPLNAFLDGVDPDGIAGRVEIPFTKLHWEARWVAPRHPIARGWERQLDHKVNPLFYDGDPTATSYRAWLLRTGVRWVALPDTRMDYSARAEARLIEQGLPYLREVWSDDRWRVFEVVGAGGLTSGPGTVVAAGPDRVVLDVARPGTVRLRMHWTPYWQVTRGDACVAPAPAPGGDDQTALQVRSAGRVELRTSFALGRVGAASPRC